MQHQDHKNYTKHGPGTGVVLVLTLVILVVVSVLAYTLAARLAAQQHRNQYMIDYQAARYACDSALKYALATLQTINPKLIARPNEPDFSDLFALTEEQYQQLLDEWNQTKSESTEMSDVNDTDTLGNIADIANFLDANSPDANSLYDFSSVPRNDANQLPTPGPYGPPWPLVAEPFELEIGPATVSIQIEDENAKMPISWAMTSEKQVQREADAALETFCEWMQMDLDQIDDLRSQLKQVAKIKPFKLDLKPITITEEKKTPAPSRKQSPRRSRRRRTARAKARPKKRTRPASAHATDFAKLFHSSLIDTEALARPVIESPDRAESALKYLGMWGSKKVNINTAPRHVLEAAFTFGGDAVEIADKIIERRRIKPFKDINDLKKHLLTYAESIRKTEKYIITQSSFFTIKITAVSGVAQTSAIASLIKDKNKVEKLAILFE